MMTAKRYNGIWYVGYRGELFAARKLLSAIHAAEGKL